MLDDMKRALLAGLGGVVLSRDKLEEWRKRLVKEKKMSEEESRNWIDDLVESGEKQWKDLETSFKKTLQKNLHSLDIADRKEVEGLRLRVQRLEERLSTLEGRESNPDKGAEKNS